LSPPTDWSWLTNHAKASGKTTALVAAAKAINGILVCFNQREADRVTREHGIRTMSMQSIGRGLREPFLFEPEAVGCLYSDYESELARKDVVLQQALGDVSTLSRKLELEIHVSNSRSDCRGGPGTTNPACGACITCLHRVIEAQERAIEIARKQGCCDQFCRMPPREVMKLSPEKQLEWRAARREKYPDGVPCDCWKANMNAALKGT